MKIVYKPWGKEIWIELNEFYCYKHIYINKGYQTSLQYHEKKMETMYIANGEAEIQVGDKKVNLILGEHITIFPNTRHRTIAVTDLVIHEISTPEVNDVQRIDDDFNRLSGLVDREHCTPAFCIIMAGKGTRLGDICEHANKGLLPFRNQAAISHIIDKVPVEFDIILAVNHGENLVREYCKMVHSDRNIVFVKVDDIDSPKSGPGHSLFCCKELLQRPFYIAVADCLFDEELPNIYDNWIGVHPTGMPERYSTAKIDDKMKVIKFKNKDQDGYDYAFIGLCAILDYEIFWSNFESCLQDGELVDIFIKSSIFPSLSAKVFEWTDLGTIENYLKYHNNFTMPKPGAFTYKINNKCIKLFTDSKTSQNRIHRATYLHGIVPRIDYRGYYAYSYSWMPGHTLYELDDYSIMNTFLKWCTEHLWREDKENIQQECLDFYKNKTMKRIAQFLECNDDLSHQYHINGMDCLTVYDYLQNINWEKLCNGISTTRYHGDLQFGNVIYDGHQFTLIDWRGSFGSSNKHGDVYYDLAKLYGGICMPYNNMDNLSADLVGNNTVNYNYDRTNALCEIENTFIEMVYNNDYNFQKIKLLTAIIYLNMSALHEHKFGQLLFFCGIKRLEDLRQDGML